MNNIVMYSTHCPRCIVLGAKLRNKNIKYTEITDLDILEQKGFLTVPQLEVNGKILDFKEAIDWINSQEVNAQ